MYTKLLKAFESYEEHVSNKTTRGIFNPYNSINSTFLPSLVTFISKIELLRDDDGLVETHRTLLNIEDPEIRSAIKIAHNISRSRFIKGATKHPEYASLTPLFMYAHKKHNGIQYEEWNKEDKSITVALGKGLKKILEPTIEDIWKSFQEMTPETIKELRAGHMPSGKYEGYVGSAVTIDTSGGLSSGLLSSHPVLKMGLQVWLAHPSIRTPQSMILDPNNWDNVPRAYDFIIPEELATTGDLPW